MSSYRYAKHSHPTRLGNKSVWDHLDSADKDAKLSYFQRQQVKYGRGRRGSTAVAGAWESVLQEALEAREDQDQDEDEDEGEDEDEDRSRHTGGGAGGVSVLERAAARAGRRRAQA